MTRNQIIELAQLDLTDEGLELFSSDDLTDSIQDGYNEIAAYTECIENYGTINFVSELTYYDFSSLLTNYLRILGIYNNNTNSWMDARSLKELIAIDEEWETVNGEPHSFWPIDFKYVAIFPRLASASGSMTVFYKKIADTLTSGSTPEIPDEISEILQLYIVADLLDQYEEYNKSTRYWTVYKSKLEGLKKLVAKRTLPDMLLRLRAE